MQQSKTLAGPNKNAWLLWAGAMVLGSAIVVSGYALNGLKKPDPKAMNIPRSGLEPDAEMRLGGTTHQTFITFRSQSPVINAGETAVWKINVMDKKTQSLPPKQWEPVKNFETVHQKLMHFIVISNDLTYFNHVHPEYTGYGSFLIEQQLPRGGPYKFYADYTPLREPGGKDQQEVAQFQLTAQGAGEPAKPLVADTPGADGRIEKVAVALPENQPLDELGTAPAGERYRISLRTEPRQLRERQTATLHFRIRDERDNPLTDLQPYIGAMAHAIVVSASTKIFLHTHPLVNAKDSPDGANPTIDPSGEDVVFPINFPKAGLYKFWVQFRRNARIITQPFVLNVASAYRKTRSTAANVLYVCPMHPDVTSTDPNATCPRCKMALVTQSELK